MHLRGHQRSIFSCDQAALWMVSSVRLSVWPSVRSRSEVQSECHRGQNPTLPFPNRDTSLNSHMAMKWYTTLDRGAPYCFQGHPSNFTVTRDQKKNPSILTPNRRFRTVTPVWIHWWLWNEPQNLKQHRRGVLLFRCHPCSFKVTRDKKSPNLTQIERFRTVTQVWIHWWIWNDAQSLMLYRRGAKVIH